MDRTAQVSSKGIYIEYVIIKENGPRKVGEPFVVISGSERCPGYCPCDSIGPAVMNSGILLRGRMHRQAEKRQRQ